MFILSLCICYVSGLDKNTLGAQINMSRNDFYLAVLDIGNKLERDEALDLIDEHILTLFVEGASEGRFYNGTITPGELNMLEMLRLKGYFATFAKDNIKTPDMDKLYKSLHKVENQWIERYFCADGRTAKCDFAKEYFTPVRGCYFHTITDSAGKAHMGFEDYCCVESDSEKFCYFGQNGFPEINADVRFYNNLNGEPYMSATNLPFTDREMILKPINYQGGSKHTFLKDSKRYSQMIAQSIPLWFKQGLAGEVSFSSKASFELIDTVEAISIDFNGTKQMRQVALFMDNSAYGNSFLFLQSMYFDGNVIAKPYPKLWYLSQRDSDELENETIATYFLSPHTNDAFVNLKDSPNGEILAQIPTQSDEKTLLFNLSVSSDVRVGDIALAPWQQMLGAQLGGDIGLMLYYQYDADSIEALNTPTSGWTKVLYFPQDAKESKDAFIGYIENTQIKPYTRKKE